VTANWASIFSTEVDCSTLETVTNIKVDISTQLSVRKVDIPLQVEMLVICKFLSNSKKWFVGKVLNYTSEEIILIPYILKKNTYSKPSKIPPLVLIAS
jgi:hypothetical protein